MATKIVALTLVGISVVTLGANAKPYGGGNGGYYGKYGGGKYGGVSDSYDDGYYKGSKYGGYGYNAPKPKVSWWKPWSWKYAKKSYSYSYSYGDEYEYGHDNDLTKADLTEAAHAYVGLSETLKVDVFRALPMTPATTTTTTLTTNRTTNAPFVIEMTDPNEFECTCGSNVGNLAFACISFLFDKDGNEIPVDRNVSASAIQSVYQPVDTGITEGTLIFLIINFDGSDVLRRQGSPGALSWRQGSILPHNPGGVRIKTVTETSVQFTDPMDPMNFERAPFTRVQKQGEVTCRGPQAVIEACSTRCDRAVEEKLLTKNEFAQKCLP